MVVSVTYWLFFPKAFDMIALPNSCWLGSCDCFRPLNCEQKLCVSLSCLGEILQEALSLWHRDWLLFGRWGWWLLWQLGSLCDCDMWSVPPVSLSWCVAWSRHRLELLQALEMWELLLQHCEPGLTNKSVFGWVLRTESLKGEWEWTRCQNPWC